MKLKLLIGFLLGIAFSIALVYFITDMYSTYMNWYNFATFFMIFVIGVILIIISLCVIQKLKKQHINRKFLAKKTFLSFVIMNMGLIIFGFTFYDYSTPRNTTLGERYQNKYEI